MTEKITYGELALKAMERAAIEAVKKAEAHHLKIPIWKDGAVSLVEPTEILAKAKDNAHLDN